jgi:hypothetical protein
LPCAKALDEAARTATDNAAKAIFFMMNSSEFCAGLHEGEPQVHGFYSCLEASEKTYPEAGINRRAIGLARASAAR